MSAQPTISVVVTTHDEGAELHRTVESVIANTRSLQEVIVVDDGSIDESCAGFTDSRVRVIQHDRRVGVAYSRDEGSRAARGDVLCYMDAHQRVGKCCLDRCAALALERGAITCPDVRNFGAFKWRLHGADFRLCPDRGHFSATWRLGIALRRVSQVTALRAPPYLIPRQLYSSVAWSHSLRGWGASEASMVLKSFFMGIPILHLAGPLSHHLFRKEFAYETTWDGVWRNQAIIARVCFDDDTWQRHWLPKVFRPHLTDETLAFLESPEIQTERREFLARKVRSDGEFWTILLRTAPPLGV